MAKVTIKQIAEELHLSRNTVSMAFSGNPKVSPATRQRIISYALAVGYTKIPLNYCEPDYPTFHHPEKPLHILVLRRIDQTAYWDKIINGISEEAAAYNCIIKIATVTQNNIDTLTLPFAYSEDHDACFFLHKFSPEYTRKILGDNKIGIFLDQTNYTCQEPVFGDVIKSEGRRSVMQLTQSLIRQGMKKIGFMCPYRINAETFYDRYEGYCAAMREAGLPILPEYVVLSTPYHDKSISFQKALEQYPDLPEAIVCSNDDAAVKISILLKEKGIRIPEDVAITGYDNDESESFMPFFTTVDCNAITMGRRMIQQLLWRLEHSDAPFEIITITSTPIYRQSSQKNPPL